MHPWARRNIPQLAGRLALVTGANSGLARAQRQARARGTGMQVRMA
ncbi:short-chain dehydrogenase, partial [Pseudomonas aeruginosa]